MKRTDIELTEDDLDDDGYVSCVRIALTRKDGKVARVWCSIRLVEGDATAVVLTQHGMALKITNIHTDFSGHKENDEWPGLT